ncbi:FAD-dependent oxidoreductase, partial [Pseudomonas monteilii]
LAHIYFLIGVRNRLSVALSWVWNHSVGYRGSRLIMRSTPQAKRGPAELEPK